MAEPPVTILAAKKTSGSNLPINRVVIHTTSPPKLPYPLASGIGKARSTALYFASPLARGSAHYVCDIVSTEHTLPDNVIAHHAPPNTHSIGIEICGQAYYTRDQWRSDEVWPAVKRAAAVAKELCSRHNIPPLKLSVEQIKKGQKGLCGHKDVSDAFHQTNHYDPGSNFPWDLFIELVNGESSPPPAPKEVLPMFDPPLILEPIVASLKAPSGGVWLLAVSGAVYAFDAPYVGAPNGKPYFVGRQAARLELPNTAEKAAGKIYVVLSRKGERYAYPE